MKTMGLGDRGILRGINERQSKSALDLFIRLPRDAKKVPNLIIQDVCRNTLSNGSKLIESKVEPPLLGSPSAKVNIGRV